MKSFKIWREEVGEDGGFLGNISTQRSGIIKQIRMLMQKINIRDARLLEVILALIIHESAESGRSSVLLRRLQAGINQLKREAAQSTDPEDIELSKLISGLGAFWSTLESLADKAGGETEPTETL